MQALNCCERRSGTAWYPMPGDVSDADGGRIIARQFDDPYQLDEKGIFDLVNLNRDDLGGLG